MILSRRFVLMGGAALVATASCTVQEPTDGTALEVPADDGVALVALFAADGEIAVGREHRLPFALADPDGTLRVDVPDQLEFRAVAGGRPVQAPTVVRARRDGIERPYYPVAFAPVRTGLHRIVTDVNGATAEASVGVRLSSSSDLRIGRPLPPVFTPTFDNHRAVDPLCTRVPICPLHAVTVRDALRERRPVAVLVAAPGGCEISYCPPALELLIAAAGRHPGTQFLHAEVYENGDDESDPLRARTEIVRAYGLDFEPALFITDAQGSLQHRLDHIFDRSELEEALDDVERR